MCRLIWWIQLEITMHLKMIFGRKDFILGSSLHQVTTWCRLSLSLFCLFLLLFLSCLFVLPIFVFSFESFCLFQLLFLQFFAFLFVWFWTILLFYHFFPFVHLLLTLCIRCNLYYFLVFPLPLVLAIIQLIFFLLWLYPRVIYFSTS